MGLLCACRHSHWLLSSTRLLDHASVGQGHYLGPISVKMADRFLRLPPALSKGETLATFGFFTRYKSL
jgi:hypothetical protein